MDTEKIGLIAQEISFAFEDLYHDVDKRNKFTSIFDRYLVQMDPSGTMEPYDAIILLGRAKPEEFKQMLKELKEFSLIPD